MASRFLQVWWVCRLSLEYLFKPSKIIISLQKRHSHPSFDVLKAEVSHGLCAHLGERILALEPHGLAGLWMNVDAFNNFNAGTIMWYREDNWDTIKKYSGLWKSDGRLHNIAVWHKKLPGIETKRRDYNSSLQVNESLWFNFSVKRESVLRVTRGTLPLPSISEISSSCTPGEISSISEISSKDNIFSYIVLLFYDLRYIILSF